MAPEQECFTKPAASKCTTYNALLNSLILLQKLSAPSWGCQEKGKGQRVTQITMVSEFLIDKQ
jgi:hypothetical protein